MDKDTKKGFKKILNHRIDLDNVMTYYPVFNGKFIDRIMFLMYKGSDPQVWWDKEGLEKNLPAEKILDDLDIIFFGKSEAEQKLFE